MSIINPYTIPIVNFIASIVIITLIGAALDISIGNISSEVDKYTEIRVPKVIIFAAYRLVAATEKPHCGNIPKALPN